MAGTNEATPLLMEYTAKQKLSKLGYKLDLGSESVFKVECFVIIADEISRRESEEIKRKRR